ncbi:unnamed protein product [Acanthoscelides obtectus]|uniref:Uncharacterized protein n=1 Tax=Acanthoscelides obtectus TaxID=200917 RepID=A0A9P0LDV4_ACAOB|nr:unnamed protein product [Acanthoscelides obtectus]CAK1621804.1 hypothetical protein AOBTE_LOCUS1139 [Acanthoscelides obtectus]
MSKRINHFLRITYSGITRFFFYF